LAEIAAAAFRVADVFTFRSEVASITAVALTIFCDEAIRFPLASKTQIWVRIFTASELILPDVVIANKIFSGNIVNSILALTKESVSGLAKKAPGIIMKSTRAFLEGATINGKEIAEEEINTIGTHVINQFLNPGQNEGRDLASDLVETARQTGLSMFLPSIAGGVRKGFAKPLTVMSLNNAALNIEDTFNIVQDAVDNGLSEKRANEIISIVSIKFQHLSNFLPTFNCILRTLVLIGFSCFDNFSRIV